MKEVNNLRGIPYSDYFSVLTEWVVVALPATTGASASCKVTIFLDFEFHKYTWLQGTIESNTKAELIEMYELWLGSAQESLRRALDRKMSTLSTLHALRENLKGLKYFCVFRHTKPFMHFDLLFSSSGIPRFDAFLFSLPCCNVSCANILLYVMFTILRR